MGKSIAKIKRLENWPSLLSAFLKESADKPFVWGQHDCVLFVADCVNKLTGVDFGKGYRGKYHNSKQAKAIVDDQFNGNLTNVFDAYFGDAYAFPLKAKRGDVCLTEINGITCGGIVDDTGMAACFITVKDGLVRIKLNEKMLIWGY